MLRVTEVLEQISFWVEHNASPLFPFFNPPATLEEIEAVEKELGLVLPDSLRVAYLMHNGENLSEEKDIRREVAF